ncbi:unnamed protein product [Haemonchus placei]|uniref:Uncharacterized protein n=1 Tax=Haemonchus placei TaxID=6290 RepID=A0A158QL98_HAEPC|nr:unnamed protein product [Haemonchus placei]
MDCNTISSISLKGEFSFDPENFLEHMMYQNLTEPRKIQLDHIPYLNCV